MRQRRQRPASPAPHAPRAVVWAVGDAATPGPAPDRIAGLVRRARPDLLPLPRRRVRDRHAQRVPALVPPALRLPRRHHHAHDRQPRVGQPVHGLLPVLGRAQGPQPAALVEAHDRGLADPGPELTGASRPGSPQVHWLESTLAGAQGDCRIAFWHRPRYSEGAVRRRAGPQPALEPARRPRAHRAERPRPQPPAPPPAARHRRSTWSAPAGAAATRCTAAPPRWSGAATT